ncbi:MAG TPA: HetZ-related protein [Oscillatoriales cyanobacterium M59_W2019_021]|nr:HetZ-related protein [Oscillatoriales cyanobacterium M4454_W2019_049]HIK50422.1 HetZ-related protein [Oscillatoriales cyanobacterium M59_W2019_021]
MNTKLAQTHLRNNSTAPLGIVANSIDPDTDRDDLQQAEILREQEIEAFAQSLLPELQAGLKAKSLSHNAVAVAVRIAREVDRICRKSDRIQNSGDVEAWKLSLARHRLQKILAYYRLGSERGRVELHSTLSTMVYRHIAPAQAQLGFQARYNLIEDFLQGFYIETLRAFRREHAVLENYSPRTRLELAEYMTFAEQYAKRRISLPGRNAQQLVILRAQGFAKGQPPETCIDLEVAMESAKSEETENHGRSSAVQQVREQMVAEANDPAESVVRDRVIDTLIEYFEAQGQSDCIDYLVLRLQDLPAHEIDEILGLSSRQRDYLQQRFKYHVEKFARTHHWKLVHQWLDADLDRDLGMSPRQWNEFRDRLSSQDQRLLELKREGADDTAIAASLKCTPKQAQKRWTQLLNLAWQTRNAEER